ncbi:MAG: LacI family DNA-binding transcriptional regulator [Propionibacteriaceae bacterium]
MAPRSRATIRDVAVLAGVGTKTVSRVINDEPNVSAAMRERVQRAVTILHFQPNLGAGTLRRGDRKTYAIGLLLDAVDNPFSAALSRGVETVASPQHFAVLAASCDNDAGRERTVIDAFTRRRVDGLILTTVSHDHGYLRDEREQGTPIVFVDRPPAGLVTDAVLSDHYGAAANATRHLMSHGHTRIAYLGDELTIFTARERHRAFAETMAAAGLPSQHRDDLGSESQAYDATRELLAGVDPPTALFTSQNVVTIGAVHALHDLGCQHAVALVGLDDLPLADLIDPPITVIAQDPYAIGRLAARRILARLDGDRFPASATIVPTTLRIRGSGEIEPPA